MSCLVFKKTFNLLKTYNMVFVPYNSTKMTIYKSIKPECFQNLYRLIPNPLYTYNENYYFISNIEIERDYKYYNVIASELRERDMFGDVLVYKKNNLFTNYALPTNVHNQ